MLTIRLRRLKLTKKIDNKITKLELLPNKNKDKPHEPQSKSKKIVKGKDEETNEVVGEKKQD